MFAPAIVILPGMLNGKAMNLKPVQAYSLVLACTLGLANAPEAGAINGPGKHARANAPVSLESLSARQDLNDALTATYQLIQKTSLEVDFVMSEVEAEQNVYEEILNSYQNARDNTVARNNALAFVTNGALWAVCEGLSIPTYKQPRLSIPSGTTGIIAGAIPSVFSLWAMHQQQGKKTTSETAPNILAKLFDYPITPDIDYPLSVWHFLQSVPPEDSSGKTRREQLISRWLSDKNLPDFTDPSSRNQLDIITASVSHRRV